MSSINKTEAELKLWLFLTQDKIQLKSQGIKNTSIITILYKQKRELFIKPLAVRHSLLV